MEITLENPNNDSMKKTSMILKTESEDNKLGCI